MTESNRPSLRQVGVSISKLTAGETVNKLTRFAATVLLARTLSLSEFGIVNVGIAISGILLTLTSLGLPEYGAREVAVSPRNVKQIGGLVVYTRLGALSLASVIALLGTAILAPSQLSLVTLAIVMTLGLAGSADWLLRGREQMGDVATATSLGGIVVLVGCATIVLLLPTTAAALIVFAVGEASAGFYTWRRAKVGHLRRPAFKEAWKLVKSTWPLGASGIIIYASYANLDSILLAALRSDTEAGLYSAPYRLFLAANSVIIFAAYALLPMLARSHHEGRPKEKRNLLLRAFRPLAAYGLVILGAAELLGGPFIETVFGADFAGTESAFILLCMSTPLYAIGYPAGYSLIGEQRNWRFFVGGAIAGTLNLVLMILLIPNQGIDGAAIATTAGLVGGGIAWLVLSDSLRPTKVLFGILTLFSLLAILAAQSTAFAIPIGFVTTAAGLSLGLPQLLRTLRRTG